MFDLYGWLMLSSVVLAVFINVFAYFQDRKSYRLKKTQHPPEFDADGCGASLIGLPAIVSFAYFVISSIVSVIERWFGN